MTVIRQDGRRWSVRWLFAGNVVDTAGAIALDAIVVGLAYGAALFLRFDSEVPHASGILVLQLLPLLALAYVAANAFSGVYRTVWAYGGLGDIIGLFRAVACVTAVVFFFAFFPDKRHLPLGAVLMGGFLVFAGMAVVKMRTRLISRVSWGGNAAPRLLIVGAGHTGQLLARELQAHPHLEYQPIGYLDDDPKLRHTRIHGLRVLGEVRDLEHVIDRYDAEIVAIALPRGAGAAVRDLVAGCQHREIPVRMVPSVDHWVLGTGGRDALRAITLDDLLGREPVQVDANTCSDSVRDKVVLVTGAAGSIGSELCRQLLGFRPLALHLLDTNESGLYDLSFDLAHMASPDTTIKLWVASVVDEARIDQVFDRIRPEVVYHAAALKHVPLMEDHPDEAFKANVKGTLHVASAARRYQAGTFVLISTDKAVRPTSLMGATKRIAELLVLAYSRASEHTRFAAVRFGNVMGSRGSVVPHFMAQIERGGPVTVVHPDAMRYFISIPEAVSLVIQAGAFSGAGSIYMLDMGEEINILDLAERIIRLRGLRPNEDIKVVFTGPRPGEKLREELVADFEQMLDTAHPKVRQLVASVEVDEAEIARLIAETEAFVGGDPDELKRRIHLVVRRFGLASGQDDAEHPEEVGDGVPSPRNS
ncbi:MAG: polysaccharide biosynthesis protein [Dehalococcoidia bacterium]